MSATKAKYEKLVGELIMGQHYCYMIYGLEKRGGRYLYQCIFFDDKVVGDVYSAVVDAKKQYIAWKRKNENEHTQD